jgi:hypothetical protein
MKQEKKMKSIYRLSLKQLVRSKRLILGVCLFTVLGGVAVQRFDGGQVDAELLIYHQIIQPQLMNGLFIPYYLLLLGVISQHFLRYQTLVRYPSVKGWWNDQLVVTFLYTTLYTGLVHLTFGVTAVVLGAGNVTTFHLIGVSFFIQVLGYFLLGLIYHNLALLTNAYAGFFITVILVNASDVMKRMLKLEFRHLQDYMSLSFYHGEKIPMQLTGMDGLFLCSFFFVVVVLYYFGSILSHEKDYLWGR